MAFVPFEERPLEQWIISFFKAIYSPTIYNWKKSDGSQKFFQDETPQSNIPGSQTQNQEIAAKAYLEGSKTPQTPLAKLEVAEQNFLSKLSGIFAGVKVPVAAPAVQQTTTVVPAENKKLEIPVSTPVKIAVPQTSHLVVEEKPKVMEQTAQVQTQQVNPTIVGEEIVSTKEAIFSIEAAPPNPPTSPNVIVGQVVDEGRKIIEGTIIEIRDEYGRPIRALRSNKLGHFVAVTPLENGKYSIISEKDGYQFMPVNFETNGQIVPPILVIGKRLVVDPVGGLLNQGLSLHTN